MKTKVSYAIELGKDVLETLEKESPAFLKNGESGKTFMIGNFSTPFLRKGNFLYFLRHRDAYLYAIWCSGWVASVWSNGKVPIVNYIGRCYV